MQFRTRAAFGVAVLIAMAGLGYLLYERGLGRAEASGKHSSIAVLPFTNLSGDASKDYFSDGMSEELLNLLARVPGLQVAARTSAFAFKGRNVDIREVGRELGVETVLEGSVRQSGDQVRITAQLIDTETGFHLWSETYDRKLQDIFAVQDEIAQAIVDKLKIELAPKEQQLAQRDKAPTQNVEAYELYLQGRAIWKRRGEDNLRRAIDMYQAALARDPAFARAHAALASAYVVLPGYTKDRRRRAEILGPGGAVGAAGAGARSEHRRGARGAGADQFRTRATCSTPSPASSSRSRSSRTSRRRTTGTRSCSARSAGSTPRSSRRVARTNSTRLRPCSRPTWRHAPAARRRRRRRCATRGSRANSASAAASDGIDATVAMRRGQWDEAKRLLLAAGQTCPES